MPVINGQGVSDDWTPTKQRFFRGFVRVHLRLCSYVMPKWGESRYTYFDLNAGPGVNPETGSDGSPLIFAQEAERSGIEYQAYMMEVNQRSHEALAANLDAAGAWRAAAIHADHNEYMKDFMQYGYRKRFGLAYADPTGVVDLPFDLLANLSFYWRKLDILMMVQGASIKRCAVVHDYPRLLEQLNYINKRYWLVREPEHKHEFTFLYGTGDIVGRSEPPLPTWKREGFYLLDSDDGRRIIDTLNWSKRERKERDGEQLQLL